ncbi:alternate-type signal peptide domain-containing protein [Microbacterium stercoris]|uniref:Alternate-type signal peptide domain-containing protein n=1 Tax=Microbacterium stercoris TaxID=2820289 RepID=A0A939QLI1_9MICO|nr:alternate-type signal peptide domain-containing protein [Microbacterium stercoris]MBO3665104.1 alternate-type signal peptide domain-containing protein [Microbacterium stercoris]
MNKSTKGALAITAAAVLLLGGGGTLAYWTATAEVEGGAITHGTLGLTAGACDATWFHADGGTVSTDAAALVVPGDQVGKTCTFTIDATGDHLAATLSVPSTLVWTGTDGTSFTSTVAATYAVGGTAIADGGVITDADDGQTLTATVLVDIPFGDADVPAGSTGTATTNGNDTQSLVATLDTLLVTLTQTNH